MYQYKKHLRGSTASEVFLIFTTKLYQFVSGFFFSIYTIILVTSLKYSFLNTPKQQYFMLLTSRGKYCNRYTSNPHSPHFRWLENQVSVRPCPPTYTLNRTTQDPQVNNKTDLHTQNYPGPPGEQVRPTYTHRTTQDPQVNNKADLHTHRTTQDPQVNNKADLHIQNYPGPPGEQVRPTYTHTELPRTPR